MPTFESPENTAAEVEAPPLTKLPFPPVTKSHILRCSYDYWHSRYRSSALKSRIIPLNPAFLSYLRADGIILTSEADPSEDNDDNDDGDEDPSHSFPEIHQQIKDAIANMGGLVVPKLNWSAPKDATWISMKKNSMECATPNDIYLLLKSSDFVTHDLQHAFDGCAEDGAIDQDSIKYVLVLRKWFKVNPSCEFRCFVRERKIVGICQRDLNHFEFLFSLVPRLRDCIQTFFDKTLRDSFPDENFTFDVYLPEPYDRVRLMDINPWAARTDPLLFSWLELLTMKLPAPLIGIPESSTSATLAPSSSDEDTDNDGVEEVEWRPEFRLVKKDDPEAYSFASPQYSAHKLPRDVVDASLGGESSMREFADQWKRMLNGDFEMGPDSDDEQQTRRSRSS